MAAIRQDMTTKIVILPLYTLVVAPDTSNPTAIGAEPEEEDDEIKVQGMEYL